MSRELYGILIGGVSLLSLLLPLPLFVLVIALLSLLMAWELSEHLGVKDVFPAALFSPLLFYLSPPLGGIYVSLISLAYGYRKWDLDSFLRSLFILFYTGFFTSFLIYLKEKSTYVLLILLLSVWANDIFAYYVGKNFGRTPLFPKLSPKKTVEGFLGGMFAGVMVFSLLSPLPLAPSFLVALFFLLAGVFGDYFKSFIKRQLGIKDFSNILGEHGGFVDRFDALLFASPVLYWLLSEYKI